MEVQIDSRNVDLRKSWQEKIDDEKLRLLRHHPGLVHSLRVSIEDTTQHKTGGYELRLIAGVPNDTVIVKKKGEAVRALIVDAFDTLGLQLKELQRKRRQTTKEVEGVKVNAEVGIVKSVFPFESYGFIVTPEGREIYFHENSLKETLLDELSEGDEVKFGEAEGDKGPHATWLKKVKSN